MFSKELRMLCVVAGLVFAAATLLILAMDLESSDTIIYCGFGFASLLVIAGVAPGAFRGLINKIGNRIEKE